MSSVISTRQLMRVAASTLAVSASLGCIGHARAQDATAQSATPAPVQDITVTGSRIASPDATSISPISTISGADLSQRGVTRIEDLINTLPQAYADQGGNNRGGTVGASGTATINLRNLGNQRTLVLIDGRRLMQGDPDRVAAQAPDINNVPAALVERIDVVTGGASAVYGSDALAGVVNFVLKHNFSGFQLDATNGLYSHSNGNPIRSVAAAAGQPYAQGDNLDGGQRNVSLTFGKNFSDGRGNVTAFVSYREIDGVGTAARDFSACNLGTSAGGYTCSLSSATNPAQFQLLNPATGATRGSYTIDSTTGNTLRTYRTSDGFNNGNTYDLQSPDKRWNADIFAHYDFSPAAKVYGEFMYMHDAADIRLSPTAVFTVSEKINCSNPYLSAQEANLICSSVGLTPAQSANVIVSQRNVAGGSRHDYTDHAAYRGVLGMKGDFGADWHYDVYGQYGRTDYNSRLTGDISLARFADALQAVNSGGQIVCQSGNAGCVPINIFATNGITQNALGYVSIPFYRTGYTEEKIVSGSLSGHLPWGSPLAAHKIGIAVGAEYRDEGIGLTPDSHYASKDVAGNSGGEFPISGSYDVKEVFGELEAPLVEDKPFVRSLSANLGIRYSDYSTAGSTVAWKAGGEWSPFQGLRLRGGFQHAVRAPNLVELFGPQQGTTATLSDPCEGATPIATRAQCAASGVTAAQYGNIAPAAGQKSGALIGGNPNLKPETSSTVTFGGQFSPPGLRGVTLGVDYFNIKVKDLISTVPATIELSQCINTGQFCNLIQRNAATGSLVTNGYVVTTSINAGYLKTAGIDFTLAATQSLDDLFGTHALGKLRINFAGTKTNKYEVQVLPGTPAYRCDGYFGVTCGMPIPHWRHRMVVDWISAGGLDVTTTWRYIGGTSNDKSSSAPYLSGTYFAYDAKLSAVSYFDFSISKTIARQFTLRAGVNNAFDKDPPLTASVGGQVSNGDFFGGMYDALGRYMFVGITARL